MEAGVRLLWAVIIRGECGKKILFSDGAGIQKGELPRIFEKTLPEQTGTVRQEKGTVSEWKSETKQ